MNNTAIKIENISKLYRLGEVGTGTLSHDLNRWMARIRGKEDPYSLVGQVNDRTKNAESDYVWALKNINIDIQYGEIVGIIGGNGAGKSTLLKLISRITSPTEGEIKIRGRIGSLLEVGTGMHPEMTARENIYLNGTIMGMKKNEISDKFDGIVDFAGCSLYVDTPLKRFSTGMRVRLGFAVAAFLEPEILIVDEVLAVGDAEFQKRAIGKMKDINEDHGRSILFVSHNMSAVRSLCTRAILLEYGEIKTVGNVDEIISSYIHPQVISGRNVICSKKSNIIELRKAKIEDQEDYRNVDISKPIKIIFEFENFIRIEEELQINVLFYSEGICVFASSPPRILRRITGKFFITCKIPPNLINDNFYNVILKIVSKQQLISSYENVIMFQGVDSEMVYFGKPGKKLGLVKASLEWKISEFVQS